MSVGVMERVQREIETASEKPVAAAMQRIRPYIARTALASHEILPNGIRLMTKNEHENETGSYKRRGALHALLRNPTKHIMASMGNAGSGAAWAARMLDLELTVGVPETAAFSKRHKIQSLGGNAVKLVVTGKNLNETRSAMYSLAAQTGLPVLEAFDAMDVIMGQGTATAEALEQRPDTDLIFDPVGGAGKLAGTLQAIAESGTRTRVVAVQYAGNNSLERSLEAGEVRSAANVDSLCDGIAVQRIGEVCFRLIEQHSSLIQDIVTVTPADIGREIFYEDLRRQQLVPDYGTRAAFEYFPETTGFVGLAGAQKYARHTSGHDNETWIAMVTGSNTDPDRESAALNAYLSKD